MTRILTYLLLTIVAAGCSESDFEYVVEKAQFVTNTADDIYCSNELALIRADSSAVFINPNNFEGKRIVEYLDSIFGDKYCDLRTECWLPLDIVNRSFTDSLWAFPLKIKNHKICEDRFCGYKNYMEVLFNTNHQILFEGEYIQMNEVETKVLDYYAYADSTLHVEPRKTYLHVEWDSDVKLDSLSKLYMNVVDGYLMSVDKYCQGRFTLKVCDLDNSQMDTLQQEFPFNLEFPLYSFVVPPPPSPLPVDTNEITF
jgi:hypothetical protein